MAENNNLTTIAIEPETKKVLANVKRNLAAKDNKNYSYDAVIKQLLLFAKDSIDIEQ